MSDLANSFLEKAKKLKKKLVLAEGEDERMLKAADYLSKEGIANIITLGDEKKLKEEAKDLNLKGVQIISPEDTSYQDEFVKYYCKIRPEINEKIALRLVKKDLMFASLLLATGKCDGMVAGISSSTASVLQAAALAVGYEKGVKSPSSFFIMVLPEFRGEKNKVLIFADCAVAVEPDEEALARLAIASARNAVKLVNITPKIAFLSFSTKGSAISKETEKVRKATEIAAKLAPDLDVDGELQADAALIPEVASKKLSQSHVAGCANILIFPDLDSGNIAYKLTQYLAKAKAIGPIMQGFNKPVNDLSRGASVEDIIQVAAITAIQTGGN